MAANGFQVKIDSILGGQGPTTHFMGANQFRASLGIDPAQPIDDSDGIYSTIASALLRPTASEKFSGSTIASAPLFIIPNPKEAHFYVYDANGSSYSVDATVTTVTALADGGSLTGSIGNGAEYYDNYIYFAKNIDIARYGPLNGSPAFNGTYWTSTLGKVALANTTYPVTFKNSLAIPNHPMCRHSDGRLYFGDLVGNQGTIHYIKTTLTTVEGDTDSSSKYNALQFGYGLWPTVLETYGTDLAIAIYEGGFANLRQKRAKIAFWDTVSQNINQIVWVEFPDTIITAMKNVNGALYVVSGNINNQGFRITKFLGGYSFEEVYYSETGEPCMPGAIDGVLNRVLFGSYTTIPETDGCVYSIGLQKATLGQGMFNVMRATGGNYSTCVNAVCIADNVEFGFFTPVIGWTQAGLGSTGVSHGLDKQGTQYSNAPSVFWSQLFRIGQPFKITKIRIPLAKAVATNMVLTVKVYTDDGAGTTYTLTPVTVGSDVGLFNIVRRSGSAGEVITGQHNFWLEFRWTGSVPLTVNFPIAIQGEYTDD